MKYSLAERIIDTDDIASLIAWLQTNPQLTKGTLTPTFERQWADWIGTTYAVFCNSGSSANLLMAYALLMSGTLRNRKVVVPSVGWVTTVAPFIQFGFEPIMCRADAATLSLDLDDLERICAEHDPATVIAVHVLGVPANVDRCLALAERYRFTLLEDACAALGAAYRGKRVGSFGAMGSFSFYFGHQLSTIEGGMVNTDSKELYDLLLMLRSHGWGKDLDPATRKAWMERYGIDDWHEPFTFFLPGFNLRSTDLQARIGLEQMRKADTVTRIRMANHRTYVAHLTTVQLQTWDANATPCSISLGALAQNLEHRRAIVQALDRHGIETRLFSAGNLGRHPFWAQRYGVFADPVSDRVHECGFFLPNNESITEEAVRAMCDVVNAVPVPAPSYARV